MQHRFEKTVVFPHGRHYFYIIQAENDLTVL